MTELVVIHGISLPPGQYGGPEIEALFTNTLDPDAHPYFAEISGLVVSAHFLLRRTGEVGVARGYLLLAGARAMQ